MPKISLFSSGPEVGNRFGSKSVVQSQKEVSDQLNLNATINRINNLRSRYDAVPAEGQRVAGKVHERGEAYASTGAERAQQLRGVVNQSIGEVQRNSSQKVAGKTAIVLARSQPVSIESGKGGSVDFSS